MIMQCAAWAPNNLFCRLSKTLHHVFHSSIIALKANLIFIPWECAVVTIDLSSPFLVIRFYFPVCKQKFSYI